MPAYNSFNLATQGRNGQPNITTNYYNGIARSNPIGDQLGNQSAVQTRPATSPTPNNLANTSPQTRNPYGRSGFNIENTFANIGATTGQVDPRLYNYGYNQVDQSEGGTYRTLGNDNVNERGLIRRNGSEYAQVGEAMHKVIDPSKVFYDEEFGYLTDPSNINNPDSAATRFATWAVPLALGGITAASALGAGAGAVPGATGAVPEAAGGLPELLGGSGGVTQYPVAEGLLAGGEGAAGATGATAGGTTWSSASGLPPPASSVGPVTGPVGYEGAAAGATAGGAGGGGVSGALNNPIARGVANIVGSAINAGMNRNLARQFESDLARLVERADTWGPENRQRAIQKLWELYTDPSAIENTPGYQFARSQGEQGVNRAAANKGYFRSPNMLFDLSQFNQGLASQTFDRERNALFAMAGVNNNPASAAQIGAQGAQTASNMNRATMNSYLAAGGNFLDWLNGLDLG